MDDVGRAPPPIPNPPVRPGARYSPERERFERTIAFLTANGGTHAKWAKYFEDNPEVEAEYVALGTWDDAKEHRRLEAGYKHAISLLRDLWCIAQNPAGEE